jgi:tRNA U34 5-carboxymethylaminomethyl modifying GTPase MnmE/TrmE
MDLNDTIVAIASAAGAGARAVIRLSGPQALLVARSIFTPNEPIDPTQRRMHPGVIRLPGIATPLPGELIVWPAPRTYTGQEMAELHTVSSPPLLELLIAAILNAGARAARPGEFTMRAFLAGKSSLFNALGGGALVSPEPGTTRDYLRQRLELDGIAVELVDTAGWRAAGDEIELQAQALGAEQARGADLLLVCSDNGVFSISGTPECPVVRVATKCDVIAPPDGVLATSAVTGAGLEKLRTLLAEHARRRAPALAPSLSRCRHHVEAALESLRRAHNAALFDDPPEVLALELRGALEQLGAVTGAVHTDDLLDRIFSRFCIGK